MLGASRSWEISKEIVGYDSFFNHSVPGGNFYDYISLYNIYKKNDILPEVIF